LSHIRQEQKEGSRSAEGGTKKENHIKDCPFHGGTAVFFYIVFGRFFLIFDLTNNTFPPSTGTKKGGSLPLQAEQKNRIKTLIMCCLFLKLDFK
jgi:hypothetical protein